jgi:hypothetical protein
LAGVLHHFLFLFGSSGGLLGGSCNGCRIRADALGAAKFGNPDRNSIKIFNGGARSAGATSCISTAAVGRPR